MNNDKKEYVSTGESTLDKTQQADWPGSLSKGQTFIIVSLIEP